jgi:hypothetical protein
MKDVSLEFVLRRLFVDRGFFHAATVNLDKALLRCGYSLSEEDKAYIRGLLKTKLDAWPQQNFGELLRFMHAVIAAYSGTYEPYPDKATRGFGIGGGHVWIIKPDGPINPGKPEMAQKAARSTKKK